MQFTGQSDGNGKHHTSSLTFNSNSVSLIRTETHFTPKKVLKKKSRKEVNELNAYSLCGSH